MGIFQLMDIKESATKTWVKSGGNNEMTLNSMHLFTRNIWVI